MSADKLGDLVSFAAPSAVAAGELNPRVPAYVPNSEAMWRRRSECRMPNAVVADTASDSTVILALDSIEEDAELV